MRGFFDQSQSKILSFVFTPVIRAGTVKSSPIYSSALQLEFHHLSEDTQVLNQDEVQSLLCGMRFMIKLVRIKIAKRGYEIFLPLLKFVGLIFFCKRGVLYSCILNK